MSRKSVPQKLPVFDKYDYYYRSVQSAETDVEFLRDLYKELRGKTPYSLREDFCGTFAISCEWAKLSKKNEAYGVDIDLVPILYGKKEYLPKLTKDEADRVHIVHASVLSDRLPKTDIVASFNFSHYIFKKRSDLLKYFRSCRKHLNKNGVLVVDAFGGKLCHSANTEKTRHPGFIYEWEQESFNEIDHHAVFHINFQIKGESKKRKHVFTYDWRMWTLPELQDVMRDAGFKKVHVYWELSDASGEGSGHFIKEQQSDECDAWVAYVVGEK